MFSFGSNTNGFAIKDSDIDFVLSTNSFIDERLLLSYIASNFVNNF